MPRISLPLLTALLALFLAAPARAQSVDPHRLYEERCAGCHLSHAGDFVWQDLALTQEGLTGQRSGRSVAAMLKAGHGRLTPQEVAILLAHFDMIRASGQLFRQKCRACHVSARDLARHSLILREGELTGRYTDRDIAAFLVGHGRLTPEQVAQMLEVLKRATANR
ncbi:hypothetical protein KBY25_17050 [Ruegeria pomeroyi]|nr:hypothetical protein [Ruegeria pomeroyi]